MAVKTQTAPPATEPPVPLLKQIVDALEAASEDDIQALCEVLDDDIDVKWTPTEGPQLQAYESEADVLLYGGQAGGGKSALLTGLALMEHKRSLIMRRQYTDLAAIIDDTLIQNGTRNGFNGSPPARLKTSDKRLIDFGGAKDPGDEEKWKGQGHDLLGIDEASQFLKSQVDFLMGWVRSTKAGQRTRVVLATNPPEKPSDGQWLIEMFAPWLDEMHPNPAVPGELRWYVSDVDGNDMEVDGPEMYDLEGRMVRPLSRTFIPAALSDNPYLADTGYDARLDNLPEPLRSAVRDGNWMIAHEDDAWQAIPTAWVMAAQIRWTPDPPDHAPMCAMGVDVAQGGPAKTVIAPRYDAWFAKLIVTPGSDTPLGSDVAGLIIKHRRNKALMVIDMGGGYGGATMEHLVEQFGDDDRIIRGFKGAEAATARTRDRQLGFKNKRAQAIWQFREALDPDQEGGSPVSLPPGPTLLGDLVATRYDTESKVIRMEDKKLTAKRLGRSPDEGDAVVMSWFYGAINPTHGKVWRDALKHSKRPKVNRGHANKRRR